MQLPLLRLIELRDRGYDDVSVYDPAIWFGQFFLAGLPLWLRLSRTGNIFKALTSADGLVWTDAQLTSASATIPINRATAFLIFFMV